MEYCLWWSCTFTEVTGTINPFASNAPFLYPLKISQNLTVFWFFQGFKKGCIGNKYVNQQSLARLLTSHWRNSSTVVGTILQHSLAPLLNSVWHGSSSVKLMLFVCSGRILKQWCSLLKNRAMHLEYNIWS